MWDEGATHAHLIADRTPVIRQNGRQLLHMTPPLFAEPEIRELAELVGWPTRSYASYDSKGEWRAVLSVRSAAYTGRPGEGFSTGDRGLVLQVKLLPHTPLSFESLGYPSKLPNLLGHSGIVVVAGGHGAGRTSTAVSLCVALGRARELSGVSFASIESPVEYALSATTLTTATGKVSPTVIQLEPGKDTRGWHGAIEEVLSGDYDIVFIGDAKPMEAGRILELGPSLAKLASSGKMVVTTVHAVSYAEAFYSLCPTDEQTKGASMLAAHLRGILVQELIRERASGSMQRVYCHGGSFILSSDNRRQLVASCEAAPLTLDRVRRAMATLTPAAGSQTMSDALAKMPGALKLMATLRD